MKNKELLTHLSQYKAEINRKLDMRNSAKHIGYQCVNGKTFALHWIQKSDGLLLHSFHIAATKNELLLAIQILHKSIVALE